MNLHQEYKIFAEAKFGELHRGQCFVYCDVVMMKLCDGALDEGRETHYFKCGVNAWKFADNSLSHLPDDAVVRLVDTTLRYSFVPGSEEQ